MNAPLRHWVKISWHSLITHFRNYIWIFNVAYDLMKSDERTLQKSSAARGYNSYKHYVIWVFLE